THIPAPPSVPFLGNISSLDKELPLRSYNLLASQYGEIFQLNISGTKLVTINTYELVHEVSDEKRFMKKLSPALVEVRSAAGDGLFTARVPQEQNWYIAHRLLMPAFSTMNVRNMFDDMMDITSQLIVKWERFGPNHLIDPASDFTKLTLDAISLCAMSYRLNSFYVEDLHPFAKSMSEFLLESGRRSMRPGIMNSVLINQSVRYHEDINTMLDLVNEILENRKANPTEKNDLLHVMLTGRDKETGQGLSDDNIKKNLLTFLIAGHETTSGMLTFCLYYLLKNPEAMRRLREEVDEKVGDRPMTINDVHKLPYLLAVMREVLRLSPSAPLRVIAPLEDTVIAGKYALEKDTSIIVNISMAQRDPKVWGPDADKFRPERMLDGKFEALPPNAWQPFGYGMRGCIGRPFAWQEVQLVLVTILQRFDLVLQDPAYELQIKQTLTIKPKNFHIRAIPRAGKPQLLAVPAPLTLKANTTTGKATTAGAHPQAESVKPLYVLYGSNTGSSESFAQRIATDAAVHGFRPTLGTLDSAVEHIPTDGPVFIVTASYEGQPADNAAHFVEWLSKISSLPELSKVKFGVFGCGNRDWVATYQRIPKLIDEILADKGATRIVARGEGDAGASDFFDSFDAWETNLWPILSKEYDTQKVAASSGISVKTVESGLKRAEVLRQADTALGTVVENKLLTSPNAPAKRHLEFALPEGATFRAGDYLAILPHNPPRDVRRAIARFGLADDQEVEISSAGPTSLPTGKPITLSALFGGYVELSQPATTRDLRLLTDAAKDSPESLKVLEELSAAYSEKVVEKRLSVLDILEDNPNINISLEQFLHMLPSMRVRQYSISSSPLWNPTHVTVTVSIIEAPARSGRDEPFQGVSSTYLASLLPGDKVNMAVRASNVAFHPPSDPAVPLVMFCAGSGLAPMRGFLQERALQKQAGRNVAKSLLFFGCRTPTEDYLYSDSDLKEWAELGIVDIRPAFSRSTSESAGCKYVQDRIWNDRAEVSKAFLGGAKFYLCGSSKVATAVKQKLTAIIQEARHLNEEEAAKAFAETLNGRFATDVFE
ncbi:bifunctional P-450/NADPH-P450 reductase, partial [Cristinia sonorae]